MNDRIARCRKLFIDKEVSGVIVSKDENVHYFSGLRADSSLLIITHRHKILITDGRYFDQAKVEAPSFEIIKHEDGLWKKAALTLKDLAIRKVIGIEGNVMTVNELAVLEKQLPNWTFKSIMLDELRQIKDDSEIDCVKRACEIADKAFNEILNHIRAGVTENEIAAQLEYLMRQNGSERAAFETIVASGLNGCYPHARASAKIIENGDFVTMDFGAVYKGYHSDITRTICVGRASDYQQRLYESVLKAQKHALTLIKPHVAGKEVDAQIREVLKADGLEEYFTHGLGHGVGLEVHEAPRLSKTSKNKELLPNMIVTDEPGIYILNFGGIRIEDTVLVTEDGCELLTHSPKNLIQL